MAAVKSNRAKLGRHSLVDVYPDVRRIRRDKAVLRLVDLPIDVRSLERLDLPGKTLQLLDRA
jgi:hypothetical protein